MSEGLLVQKTSETTSKTRRRPKLLIAASGTGGHLFPAIATAQQLADCEIEWLGVPDRLETELVPADYKLHTVKMGGVQSGLGLDAAKQLARFAMATMQVRRLLKRGQFQGVFTTGGYIAAPAILAARSLGLPAVLHESNALPGKVTRFLSTWCTTVAVGFEEAVAHLPKAQTVVVGTPVRSQFLSALDNEPDSLANLDIPADVPLIVVVGGSQGAVAVNQLVRNAAPAWLDSGAWIVHITGTNDPEADSFEHACYVHRPFYSNMAALFSRANLVISRAGAGTLIELAVTGTPSILIPYPFAAEDHQTFNAIAFQKAGAAELHQQSELEEQKLQGLVLDLLASPSRLEHMSQAARSLSTVDSAAKMAEIISAQLFA
ncbi:undecaprenyldiphospho-muramoylpentapeptide beta-N-acetylglucosaminyltransferase [cf. Phormidesmis sp. LEGE 11477]|uniref:undecaprenyldiphospho-muramoylpentapeptide beta-N-acetylglucosaminyltransferase n=1 Tax=cf. Phormidesmis sp. LEGE 11477 TaxID=1828680 RepID=UPI00187EC22A|nr:undecaprenyldiphospho-muramoylpentapeptide beta-N-acetylglucosaminyltransferase [cf. Phormidesmis sp. LEGE 11477]MBE9062097.1 undecaprenyldiphospho-muramoylpentapeptide beta-N-acetylglucosaminyltransferase [cf. Phormidesmis sp. LEGE 11477]